MRDDASVVRVSGSVAPQGARTDWFADEVAVDFPSLAALGERMRERFLATEEPRDPVAAEVRLTAWEAARGRRVPVAVPVARLCPACGGRGEVWNDPCSRCDGSGAGLTEQLVHLHVPSGVRDGARILFSVAVPQAPATYVSLEVRVA